MRMLTVAIVLPVIAAMQDTGPRLLAQARNDGPRFEVVSIRPHPPTEPGRPPAGSSVNQRPDGGLNMVNVPISALLVRAYPAAAGADLIGLPSWARTERYDVVATSSLQQATADDRIAMLRAMLADRFQLAVHIEKREQPVYDLRVARSDRRLGPGITPLNIDCSKVVAPEPLEGARPQQRLPPDLNAPPLPCTVRIVQARPTPGAEAADRLEGETTMATLATTLRAATGQMVIDKTGLDGSYRVKMNFDIAASRRGPDVGVSASDTALTVFTAIREQLGLRLDASRAERDVLVIDRLERPSDN